MINRTILFTISVITSISLLTTGCRCKTCDLRPLRERNSSVEMQILYECTELPSDYLTLDEVVAVALERNLDLLVKEWEGAVQRETATREYLKLLQSLTFSSEFSFRNENTGSFSQSLAPGIPPAPPSISSNQTVRRWDFTYTFNILDFGVSYFRAKQENDKAMIQTIEYARLQNNLILDVTRQFWKVIYAQKAIEESKTLIERMTRQREGIQREVEARMISEMPALKAEDQLLSVEIQLHAYQKEYHEGKMELARLMGYPACLEYNLAVVDDFNIDVEVSDPCALSDLALIQRPELFSLDVEELIGVSETISAIIQMFPALAPFAGMNQDGNTFLIHNFWLIAGIRAAWNLFAIPQHIAEMRIGQDDRMTSQARRMALSIGVISQVHLAYYLYKDNLEQFRLIEDQRLIKKRIYETAIRQFRVGLTSGIDVLNYQADLYISELNYLRSFAELQIALEQLNNAIGAPLSFRNQVVFKKPAEAKKMEEHPQEKMEPAEPKKEIQIIEESDKEVKELLESQKDEAKEDEEIRKEFFDERKPVEQSQNSIENEEKSSSKVEMMPDQPPEENVQIQKGNELQEEVIVPGITIEGNGSLKQNTSSFNQLEVKKEDFIYDAVKFKPIISDKKDNHFYPIVDQNRPLEIHDKDLFFEKIQEFKPINKNDQTFEFLYPISQGKVSLKILKDELFISNIKEMKPIVKENKVDKDLYSLIEENPKGSKSKEEPGIFFIKE